MHSMYNDDVVTSDFPRMGTDIPFLNVSGSVPMTGSTVQRDRDVQGRWKPRRPTLIRGLGKPGEDRGSNAVLHRDPGRGPFDVDPTNYVSPDYSRGLDHSGAHARNRGNEEFINHAVGCPSCAVNGFVKVQHV
jgi:hypothetical protein